MSDTLVRVTVQDGASSSLNTIKSATDHLNASVATLSQQMAKVGAASTESGAAQAAMAASTGEAAWAARLAAEATERQAKETEAATLAQDAASASMKSMALQIGAVVTAVAAGVTAITALTASYALNSLETQKLATMSGTTVEAFSLIRGAAEDVGVSGETVQHSLVLMQRGLQETGDQGDAFRASLKSLGVETDLYKDSATGTTDMLLALQATFAKMPDGPEKTAAALKIFGRGGAEMLEFLSQSTAGLQANMKAFGELGQTITSKDVEISRSLRNVINDFGDMAEAIQTGVGRAMAPTYLAVLEAMKDATEKSLGVILSSFGGIKGAASELEKQMKSLGPQFTSLASDSVKVLAVALTSAATTCALFATGLNAIEVGFRGVMSLFGELTEEGKKFQADAIKRWEATADIAKKAATATTTIASSIGEVSAAEKSLTVQRDDAAQRIAQSGQTLKAIYQEEAQEKKKLVDEEEKHAKACGKTTETMEYRKTLTRDQILDARQITEAKDHENAILHEQTGLYAEINARVEQCAQSHQQQLFIIGDVNAGINAMAAATANAASEAAQLESKLIGAVNAQSSLTQITSGQAMGGSEAGGQTIGGTFIPYPQQGLPGAGGMQAAENYQIAVASALEHERQRKRQDAQDARVAKARQVSEANMSPIQKAQKASADALKAKEEQLRTLQQNAGLNQQLDSLDLQIANTRAAQSNSYAGSLAGLKNRADTLRQQGAITEAQRQLSNFGAMSGGKFVLDKISQDTSIADAEERNNRFNDLFGGQNVLDILNMQAANMETNRRIGNYGNTAPYQNAADLSGQKLSLLDTSRSVSNYGAMTPGMNLADKLGDVMKNLEDMRKGVTSGVPKYASGTGLAGVPGYGSGDSILSLLTPGEIVLPLAESEAVRARFGSREHTTGLSWQRDPYANTVPAESYATNRSATGFGGFSGNSNGVARSNSYQTPPPVVRAAPADAAAYTQAMVAQLAALIANISVNVDSRSVGRVMVDVTRKGQRTTATGGSSNRAYL